MRAGMILQAITVSVNKNSGRRLIRNTGKIVENGGKLWRDVRGVCAMKKMIRYHDEEWGVPVHDDQKQFEFLMMEVMQCGLNWNMMIQKRGDFQKLL